MPLEVMRWEEWISSSGISVQVKKSQLIHKILKHDQMTICVEFIKLIQQ